MCRHANASTAHLLTLIDTPPDGPPQRISLVLCPDCLERLAEALALAAAWERERRAHDRWLITE